MARRSLAERFWSRVERSDDPDACWIYRGARNSRGYGNVYLGGGRGGARYTTAHRLAYVLTYGPVADDLEIDHLCRNRACVRPDHLEAVTPRVNTLRSTGPSAQAARQTHCKRGHPFDEANTTAQVRRDGRRKRVCRACARADAAAHRAKSKGASL